MYKPDTRPLSAQTGYLFSLYLEMKKMLEQMRIVCEKLEQTEPWYDSEHRKCK